MIISFSYFMTKFDNYWHPISYIYIPLVIILDLVGVIRYGISVSQMTTDMFHLS
jgi:hypothetical protein